MWPYPRHIATSGDELPLAKNFHFQLDSSLLASAPAVQRLTRAVTRYTSYLRAANGTSDGLEICTISLDSTDDELGLDTLYNYSIKVLSPPSPGKCAIRGGSIFGAIYALETFAQLVDVSGAMNGSHAYLANGIVQVRDSPMYKHRGLLVDAGRRFWPIDLLKDILQTMSFVKMNVLHLHGARYYLARLFARLLVCLCAVPVG